MQSTLYYGVEQDLQPRTTNHPYLKDAQYAKARLLYHNVLYPEVLLRLDFSRDELVALSPDQQNIVLFPENVDSVELHGQHIIYFRRDTLSGCPSSGYYILLHSGKYKVLEKNTASLKDTEGIGNQTEWYYAISTQYYLFMDDAYYNVSSQRSLLKALALHKKELKRFISANHLKFRKNAEEFLSRTVNEYEIITGAL